MNKKALRSRWCHPDDREIVQVFLNELLAKREGENDNAAVRMTNSAQCSFLIDNLNLVDGSKRIPISYAGRGKIIQPTKKKVVTPDQIKEALK